MCTHWNSDQQTRLVSDTQIVNMRALETGAQVQQVSKMFGSLSLRCEPFFSPFSFSFASARFQHASCPTAAS
jgi:hypothetical protein